MIHLPIQTIVIGPILEETKKLQFEVDGSGAKMAFKPCCKPDLWIVKYPYMGRALQEISWLREAKVLFVMVNIVPPGCVVPNHTDTLFPHPVFGEKPQLERWHLPLQTNDRAEFGSMLEGAMHLPVGYWHGPIKYWETHAVWNLGKEDRIHLVVDLDVKYELPLR